ncbi:hypothetical protein AB0M87_15460 [Streptomyces sp. NPDC051320]|uniref:hypothetical protein n=1 Tax=Streptomyces sp. NPDC051320 TaxID=3154644 RepID=UPI00343DD992
MIDVMFVIFGVVGAALLIQAVWDLGRTRYEGEDVTMVEARAVAMAAAGSLCALVGVTAALVIAAVA